MDTMARLATMLMAAQRRNGSHRRVLDTPHSAALNQVLKLSSTGSQGDRLEVVIPKMVKAIATEHSIAQLHGIGLPDNQNHPSLSGEPLVGSTPQRTGDPGHLHVRAVPQVPLLRREPLHQV
jgi:hypothetical protein